MIMNHELINKCLSTAIELISVSEEELKKGIDFNDTEAVDLAYELGEAGGRMLKIRHEIYKKYKKESK